MQFHILIIIYTDIPYQQFGRVDVYHPEGYKNRATVETRINGSITLISNIVTCSRSECKNSTMKEKVRDFKINFL